MSKNKLYISNLDYSVTSEELSDFIGQKWKVSACNVIENRGFAFATLEDPADTLEAKESLNDQEFKGRKLKVDFAVDNRSSDRKGNRNSYGGGGGSRRRY